MRVPRLPEDRAGPNAYAMGRYLCAKAECGWEGLIDRTSYDPSVPVTPLPEDLEAAQSKSWRNSRLWLSPVPLLLAGLAVGASLLAGVHVLAPKVSDKRTEVGPLGVPLGTSHDGEELAPGHPLFAAADPAGDKEQAEGLAMRQRCSWGQPGRSPYKGTVEQALTTARLPDDIVKLVAAKVKAKDMSDRVLITNAAITAEKSKRQYDPRSVVMTYGKTLCLATQVNFKPGHQEKADLYEVADAGGKRYSVMVPDVCGNVSVLSERGRRLPVTALAEAQVLAEQGRRSALGLNGGEFAAGAGQGGAIPEPSGLWLVGLALAGLAWAGRKKR